MRGVASKNMKTNRKAEPFRTSGGKAADYGNESKI
jgi:hypothetical protein